MRMHASYHRLESATDASQMKERFRERLKTLRGRSLDVDTLRVTRVFPRSGDSFTIQYVMTANGGDQTTQPPLLLCGHLLGPDEPVPQYASKHSDEVVNFEKLGIVVPLFPFDPRLKRLSDLFCREQAAELVKKHVPTISIAAGEAEGATREVLGYRLEKRCVLRYRFGSHEGRQSVVIKVRRPKRSELAVDSLEMLQGNGFDEGTGDDLVVPRTYYFEAEKGIHLMEDVPGRSLHDLTSETSFEKACATTGRLLAKLHALPSMGLPEYSLEQELILLRVWVSLSGRVFPQMAAMFESAYDALEKRIKGIPLNIRPVCIHRDFYDKQVLHAGKRATLIDCDNLAEGDPAQDYGNFMAHIVLRGLQEPTSGANIRRGGGAFEAAYGSSDREFPERAQWWRAATLLRLAGLYGLRPRWRHLSAPLLEEVMVGGTTIS